MKPSFVFWQLFLKFGAAFKFGTDVEYRIYISANASISGEKIKTWSTCITEM